MFTHETPRHPEAHASIEKHMMVLPKGPEAYITKSTSNLQTKTITLITFLKNKSLDIDYLERMSQ